MRQGGQWSQLEENQTVGRVHRFPQKKPVICYRLLVGQSPDIFLRKIAMQKKTMLDAFTLNDDNLRK